MKEDPTSRRFWWAIVAWFLLAPTIVVTSWIYAPPKYPLGVVLVSAIGLVLGYAMSHYGKKRVRRLKAEMDAVLRLAEAQYRYEDLSPDDQKLARSFMKREGRQ